MLERKSPAACPVPFTMEKHTSRRADTKFHCKPHAAIRVFQTVRKSVLIQDGLGDIQPQAAAAGGFVAGFLHPVEGSEQDRQVIFRDGRACVGHSQGGRCEIDEDLRPFRRVTKGVA